MYFLWAVIFSFITFLIFGHWQIMDREAWGWVCLMVFLSMGILYIMAGCFGVFSRDTLTPFIYATPVLSLIWIIHILGESIDIFGYIAIGLSIAAGMVILGSHSTKDTDTPKGHV